MTAPPHPRAALVTGAARRIGRAIALDLARHGWDVAVHYRGSIDEAEEVAGQIRALGCAAALIRADLAREAETETVVPRAAKALGPLGLLVNSASTFENDDLLSAGRESWDRHLEPNLRAPLVLTQGFVRQLPAGVEGNVVNIVDQRVWNLPPDFLSYTISKAGLWAMTRSLAIALGPSVRVNAIGPGPTLQGVHQSDSHFEAQWKAIPLKRPTDPADIAAAVRFLVRTPSMTGQMLALDGGEHLGWLHPSAS